MSSKLIVILGPTASGKTKLAIKLAKKLNGEIISADSRQVYKELDIGTAKPFQNKELKIKYKKYKSKFKNIKTQQPIIIDEIPHYFIDIVKPNQDFNVAIYKKLAIKIIKDIQSRNKLPFLVGGTGLYIQAVVDNIDFPEVPPQRKLRKELEKKTIKELFEIYKKLDEKGAKFIEKKNKRRLIRAIEVCEATGKPFFEQRKKGKPLFDVLQIGIKLDKEKLKEKISKRVERMFKQDLENEVKKLAKKYGWKIPTLQTIGYREWLPYFGGKISKEKVKEDIKTHTLQFSKRQITWFKKDKRIKRVKNYQQAEKLVKEFLNN